MKAKWTNIKRGGVYSQCVGIGRRFYLVEDKGNSQATATAMISFSSESEAVDLGWVKISEEANEVRVYED